MALFKVLYDFKAEEDGELTVTAGQYVDGVNVEGHVLPEGWLYVKFRDRDDAGFVPRDYLEYADGSQVQKVNPIEKASIVQQKPFAQPATSPPSGKLASVAKLFSATPTQAKQETPFAQSNLQVSQGNSNTGLASRMVSVSTSSASPAAPPPMTSSNSSMLLNKFRQAGKIVQSASTTSRTMKMKGPSLVAAVEREDFEDLKKRNDDYFTRLMTSQEETFDSLTEMIETLSKKLTEASNSSNDLVKKLTDLDELIEVERRRWKQQNEAEKNADVLGRSKELTLSTSTHLGVGSSAGGVGYPHASPYIRGDAHAYGSSKGGDSPFGNGRNASPQYNTHG